MRGSGRRAKRRYPTTTGTRTTTATTRTTAAATTTTAATSATGQPTARTPAVLVSRAPAGARAAVALLSAAALLAGCSSGSDGDHAEQGQRAPERPAGRPGPAWNTQPASIASVGDSISRGFDACSVLSDCPEASWSTGTEVDSLARRLLPPATTEGAGKGGKSWNFAETGALMSDLPGQLRQAVAHKPDLVTVLIGANDACRPSVDDMTPVTDFRADFTASLASLRRSLPRTQIYVASVPDLERLWSQGRKNPLGKTIWRLGICPSMLKDADSTNPAAVERRRQVADRVVAYNTVLKDVCARDRLCRYDEAVHNYRFTTAQLSKWDWFHPNKEGQRVLADIAYREITRKESTA